MRCGTSLRRAPSPCGFKASNYAFCCPRIPNMSWMQIFRLKRLIALCVVFLLICLANHWREPGSEGRSLSAWLRDLNGRDNERRQLARLELAKIGTNAIPHLVARLARRENSVELLLDKVLGYVKGEQPLLSSIDARRTEAVLAFEVLGTNAAGALPLLCPLLTNATAMADEVTAVDVAHSMASVGEGSKKALLAAINHPSRNVRAAAVIGISDLGDGARDLLPSVMDRLKDPDTGIRYGALYFVSRFCESPEVKRRLLTDALRDPDARVRLLAKREIKELGSQGDVHQQSSESVSPKD